MKVDTIWLTSATILKTSPIADPRKVGVTASSLNERRCRKIGRARR